jgi:hypothetical protein
VAQLVEGLRYKPEGCGFDFRWGHRIVRCLNPSGHTMTLGSTQPLTEMSIRNICWGQRRPLHTDDKLARSCADFIEILVASTSWSFKGLSRPV